MVGLEQATVDYRNAEASIKTDCAVVAPRLGVKLGKQ